MLRCPWCGKIPKDALKNLTGSYYHYVCPYCKNDYGKNNQSKMMMIFLLLFTGELVISFFWHYFFIIFICTIPFLYFPIHSMKIQRAKKDAYTGRIEYFDENMEIIQGVIHSENVHIKKHGIYILDQSFDLYESYAQKSPIRIVNIENANICFLYLYEHKDNLKAGEITFFDEDNRIVRCAILS